MKKLKMTKDAIQRRTYYKSDMEYMRQTGRLPGGGFSERSQEIRRKFLEKKK